LFYFILSFSKFIFKPLFLNDHIVKIKRELNDLENSVVTISKELAGDKYIVARWTNGKIELVERDRL